MAFLNLAKYHQVHSDWQEHVTNQKSPLFTLDHQNSGGLVVSKLACARDVFEEIRWVFLCNLFHIYFAWL